MLVWDCASLNLKEGCLVTQEQHAEATILPSFLISAHQEGKHQMLQNVT